MMQPNIFPHKRVDTEEGLQEERRLAYVAVTRGRNQVKILMPDKNMRNEDIFSNDPKTKAVMSPYASEACIPFTRV
jgi:superfamily I DNA/RNA helicase